MNTEVMKYSEAMQAIAVATTVETVNEYRIKAEALVAYARQLQDKDLEQQMGEIKRAAEIRIGEITKELPTLEGKVGPGKKSSLPDDGSKVSKAQAIKNAKLTQQRVSEYERLSKMPDQDKREYVATGKKPAPVRPPQVPPAPKPSPSVTTSTVTALAEQGTKKASPVDPPPAPQTIAPEKPPARLYTLAIQEEHPTNYAPHDHRVYLGPLEDHMIRQIEEMVKAMGGGAAAPMAAPRQTTALNWNKT